MISYLKSRSYKKALSSHPNFNYKPAISSFNTGATIGIVSDVAYINQVEKFIKEQLGAIPNVSIIYYSEEESELPNIYTKKQVNWAGVPKCENLDLFLQKEYDRLYFLDTKMTLPQAFISHLAKAKFTIGPYIDYDDFHFDLTIELMELGIEKLITEIKKNQKLLSKLS